MSLLDHPVITSRYFFPRPLEPREPFVVEANGHSLNCYRGIVDPGGATLLHFHGNGEVAADWVHHFAAPLEEAGINVLLGEYRGFGGSAGTPQLAAMLDDALVIADTAGVSPDKLVVYGRSVGSLYALHVAAHRRVAGLVIESGIADLLPRLTMRLTSDELGASDAALAEAVRTDFDQRAKLEAHAGPVLVIHARDDHLVPIANAEAFVTWAGARAELLVVHPGDHNSLHYYNASEILERTVGFTRAAITR